MTVEERLQAYGRRMEQALDACFPAEICRQSEIFAACRYSLLGAGKRIRPALLLEFYRQCGGEESEAMAFACGVEMIHTYSLIHDDLPCMDNDDYRRGRPSNHKVYGEAMALLAGDALLNRAFEVMLSQQDIAPERAMRAAAYIAARSGVYGMIGGQVQDLALEGRLASPEEQREMVALKTCELLRAACVGGVLLAGGTEEQIQAAEQYAASVGMAFQIRDDMLDVIGSTETLGKQVGSDAANQKSTFVSLYGLEICAKKVAALTRQAQQAAMQFPAPEFLSQLAEMLAKRMS